MDALQAVGDPELRDALLFVRSRQQPVTVDELAAARGVHRNVVRRRLDRLSAAGLLVMRSERRTGRSGPGAGRPARIYSPAPETSAIEFPRRHQELLIGVLLDALPDRSRAERLWKAGRRLGAGLLCDPTVVPVPDPRAGLDQLCEALGQLGFQATVEAVGEERAVLATPTCPLRPLVMALPALAQLDRGMWCGLVESVIEGASVERGTCETHDCLDARGSCRIAIGLRPLHGSAGTARGTGP